jgi:hypothetical protein
MLVAVVGTACILLAPSVIAEISSTVAAVAGVLFSLTLLLAVIFNVRRDVRVGVVVFAALVACLINLRLGWRAWRPAIPRTRTVVVSVLGIAALPLLQFWQSTAFLPSQKVAGLMATTLDMQVQDATDTTLRSAASVVTENTSDVRVLVIISNLLVCEWHPGDKTDYSPGELRRRPNCHQYRPVGNLSWIDPKVKVPYRIAVETSRDRPLVSLTYRIAYARGDRLRAAGSRRNLTTEELESSCVNGYVIRLADESRYRALVQQNRYLIYGMDSSGGTDYYLTSEGAVRCPSKSGDLDDYFGVTEMTAIWQGWLSPPKSAAGTS